VKVVPALPAQSQQVDRSVGSTPELVSIPRAPEGEAALKGIVALIAPPVRMYPWARLTFALVGSLLYWSTAK